MSNHFSPSLAPGQVDSFRERGYTSIAAISTPDEVRWLREVYDELIEDERPLRLRYGGAGPSGVEGTINQIFLPEMQVPKLLETQYIRNAKRLAAELLEIPEATYGGLMFIFKPAAAGRDTPFHQDEVYWEFRHQRCHSLSVWMPLDEVTVDSGCMQFVPGSQKNDVLRYRKPENEPLVLDQPFDLSGAVPVPLKPGGATFHHCRTVHGTAPNTSPRPRRALTTIFHGPRAERVPPLTRPWMGES
ncbi:MAG TPA: phytanoyl-CoA dioxygenase family protein [Myxococcota bacterium]|nr:phytanoyl-CoA dioxygenase family protein [Myxococcota bacterium]